MKYTIPVNNILLYTCLQNIWHVHYFCFLLVYLVQSGLVHICYTFWWPKASSSPFVTRAFIMDQSANSGHMHLCSAKHRSWVSNFHPKMKRVRVCFELLKIGFYVNSRWLGPRDWLCEIFLSSICFERFMWKLLFEGKEVKKKTYCTKCSAIQTDVFLNS